MASTGSPTHLREQQGQDQPFGVSYEEDGGKSFSEQHPRSQFPRSQFRLDAGNNSFPRMVGWGGTGSPYSAVSNASPSLLLPFLLG